MPRRKREGAVVAAGALGQTAKVADNLEYMKTFSQYRADVLANVPDINATKKPIAGDSHLQPLDASRLVAKLGAEEPDVYTCSVNVAWLSMQTPTPELPLLRSKTESLAENFYRYPRPLKCTIACEEALTQEDVKKMMKDEGMPLASPVEHLHAWLLACRRAFEASDDDAVKQWTAQSLRVEATFKVLAGSSRRFFAMSAREDIGEEYEALRTTPLLRALSFAAFKEDYEKAMKGPQSAAALAEKYKEFCSLSKRSMEEIKPGWVDTAATFVNRMWSPPKVLLGVGRPAFEKRTELTTCLVFWTCWSSFCSTSWLVSNSPAQKMVVVSLSCVGAGHPPEGRRAQKWHQSA